ncbi:lipid phosphate phosphatase 2-like isoform X2 [Olea europaea var. sylvestris]|uniref:lipid phosphate phosphatase 2-like isoform X2 n=1 Tax=Olea europaea var. sylvestris TaxID=158386 RepID=UPI000C1D3A19|nr:lipid phosphate phosphatase 2-like isoform X2 [Olea europaea var. sylvestris]
MPEIQLGSHTIRSHGAQVARVHMHDWLILLLLVVIEIILNIIEPFHRFVGEEMMTDLKYPLQDNTIPFWAVPIIAIILPFIVIIIFYFIRHDVYDLHQAILGLLFSVLITGVITDAIKDAVGRPRPDFFWRCFPDGKGVFHAVTRNVHCTGLKSVIKEGHKSFPSGHTSSLVGVSRVDDYWHHWQDVFAGGLLGMTVASFCYLQFFPPPYDVDGWAPHSYLNVLADSRNGNQPLSINANALTVRQLEFESVYLRSAPYVNAQDSISILEDMERGRRN